MHDSHCIRVLNALRHYHGVLRVSWQILSWSLLRFDVSHIRAIVALIFTVSLSRTNCIADYIEAKLSTYIVWNLASAISAETVTRLIGVHIQSDVCTTPHAPTYRNSTRALTIWMYLHAADMSSIHSAELTRFMTRLVDVDLVWNINITFITSAIDY